MTRLALASLTLVALMLSGQADAAPAATPRATIADSKPTSEEKRCKASRRRVERQQEVIAEANARIERETAARQSCKTKRACDSLDRALRAGQTRNQRYAKQLAQLEAEAGKACSGAQSSRVG